MVIICTLCVTAFQEKDPFSKSALHQNRRIVFAFLGQEPEGRPLFAFFAKADSHHHVCLAGQCNAGVAISTIVARRQNLNVIEVNLYELYLDLKLSAIDPQSLGLKKKEILDCDRILRFRNWPFLRLWASGWIVEAPRAWVGACPRLQTQNLSVGR